MNKGISGFTIGFLTYFAISIILDIIGVNSYFIKASIFVVIFLGSYIIDQTIFKPKRHNDCNGN